MPSDRKEIIHQVIETPNLFLDVVKITLQLGAGCRVAVGVLGANLIDGEIDEIQRIPDLVRHHRGKSPHQC